MAKDPSDRWESAGAMVRALDDALTAPPPRRVAAAPLAPTAPTRVLGDRTPPPGRPARARAAGAPRRGFGLGALLAVAALLLLVAGAVALVTGGDGGGGDPGSQARQEPRATSSPERTTEPEPTATEEPTAEPTAEATEEPAPEETEQPAVPEGDPGTLQLQAYELNQAGRHEEALPYAKQAVELCEGSSQVSPCAYALYEYAVALRMTGDPNTAINVLHERMERFPDDQPEAVQAELQRAEAAAGGGESDDD
jgi:serine/threonine-protein kinase